MAKNLMICANSLGFIIVPIMLGFIIFKNGILRGILVYLATLLPLTVGVLLFRKPLYMKAHRRRYELMQVRG